MVGKKGWLALTYHPVQTAQQGVERAQKTFATHQLDGSSTFEDQIHDHLTKLASKPAASDPIRCVSTLVFVPFEPQLDQRLVPQTLLRKTGTDRVAIIIGGSHIHLDVTGSLLTYSRVLKHFATAPANDDPRALPWGTEVEHLPQAFCAHVNANDAQEQVADFAKGVLTSICEGPTVVPGEKRPSFPFDHSSVLADGRWFCSPFHIYEYRPP